MGILMAGQILLLLPARLKIRNGISRWLLLVVFAISMILYVLLNYTYMHVMPLSQLAMLDPDEIAGGQGCGVC